MSPSRTYLSRHPRSNKLEKSKNRMIDQVTHIINDITSGDDARAEKAVKQIPALPASTHNTLLQSLNRLIESDNPDHRWWALRAIALLSDESVVDILTKALSDNNPDIRQCAALGLRLHPDTKAISPLVKALEDRDNLVAALASDSLVTIGPQAVPELLTILEKGTASAKREAARALAIIGVKSAIPALIKALDDDSAVVAFWAEQGLDDMGLGTILFQPE